MSDRLAAFRIRRRLGACLLAAVLAASAGGSSPASLPPRGEPWLAVESRHFRLLTNASRRVADEVTDNMEAIHDVLLELNPGLQPRYDLHSVVVVFEDEESFAPYKTDPDGRARDIGGLFAGHEWVNTIMLDARPDVDPYPTIYHESVHAILDSLFPRLPAWLDEGLAEYYSTLRLGENRLIVGRPLSRHVLRLQEQGLMPLDDLFSITPSSPEYNEGSRRGTFYAQSWALVHHLLRDDPDPLDRVARYVEMLESGSSPARALESAFDVDTRVLLQDLRAEVARSAFPSFVVDRPLVDPSLAFPAVPAAREEVLTRLGVFMAISGFGRRGLAAEHLEEAARINPGYVPATVGLAFLAGRENRHEYAVTLLESAVATAPHDRVAAMFLGDALVRAQRDRAAREVPLAEYLRPREPVPADLLRAREILRPLLTSGRLRLQNNTAFGKTFLPEPGDVTEGIAALQTARTLAPDRLDILTVLAVLHLRSGHAQRADTLLREIEARVPHTGAALQAARIRAFEILRAAEDLLRRGETEQARQSLENLLRETDDPVVVEAADGLLQRLRELSGSGKPARTSETAPRPEPLHEDGTDVVDETASLQQARRLQEQGRLDDAARVLRSLAARAADPEIRAEAVRRLGEIEKRTAR